MPRIPKHPSVQNSFLPLNHSATSLSAPLSAFSIYDARKPPNGSIYREPASRIEKNSTDTKSHLYFVHILCYVMESFLKKERYNTIL